MSTANVNTLKVVFRHHVIPDEGASKAQNRPIYRDMEVCDIYTPGDRLSRKTFPAHEAEPNATRLASHPKYEWAHKMPGEIITYAMVYNEQYRAFKANAAQPESGTPLSEATFLTEAERRELKALNVHTIEALASLDGTPLKQIGMGGREKKNKAQAYLDAAAGTADVTGMAATIAGLQQQLEDQKALIDEFTEHSAKTKEQRQVEREFARSQADETKDSVKAQTAVQKSLDKSDEKWLRETEKVERGTLTASTDFDKWSDDQLKDFIRSQTGTAPRGQPSHVTLVAMAKEVRDTKAKGGSF